MKKQILIIFMFVGTFSYGQISYEAGYFINNSSDTTSCLIKNLDWLNNPGEFKYVLSQGDEDQTASITEVSQFGIYNTSKYVRHKVNIDRSPEEISKLESDRNPVFKEETLFLKVIIDGEIPLYSYNEKGLQRYFYNTPQSKVEQLVFKSYITNGRVRQNNLYKQQLLQVLNCDCISPSYNESITYSKNDLAKYFSKYYECNNYNYTHFKKVQKDLFNLSLRPGVKFASLLIDNPSHYSANLSFANNVGFRIGAEIELVMPFNKNKWAITFEPTYKSVKSETQQDGLPFTMNYSSIDLPIGLRHYFFLNTSSKIFLNLIFATAIPLNSTLEWETGAKLDISNSYYMGVGIGYQKNKINVESRYSFKHDLLGDYVVLYSDYSELSIIFGYRIF